MSDNIVVAIISLIGVVVTAYFSYMSNKRKNAKLTQMDKEMDLQRSALSLSDFLSKWPEIYKDIMDIMETTNVDRFMVFRAWNGELDPKWTTSIFQIRQGDQEPISYVHFEIDDDYAERLRIIKRDYITFNVDELSDSMIKRVYKAEGIKSSLWSHIEDKKEGKSASHTYCSFSTHDGEIDDYAALKCKILTNKLREAAHV